jgi:acetyl esterase
MRPPETVEAMIARTIPRLPAPLLRAVGGAPIRIDGQELHPEIRFGMRLVKLIEPPPLERLTVAEAREQTRRDARVVAGPRIEVARVEELGVPSLAGELRARLYVPSGLAAPAPLLLWLHGGGWVVGDLDTHDQLCRYLAREASARVLALDYRLAPEHPFPAAVEDALAGFRFAAAEAERLRADPNRIAIGGDSAGANLAAVTCLALRDGEEPSPAAQVLVYPVTDASRRARSYELFAEGFFLTAEKMEWYFDHYLPEPARRTDPRASPLLAAGLGGLPHAHVLTAGFDVLRDEGDAYAERLREAGVAVTHQREGGLVHGFVNAVGLGGAYGAATARLAEAIRAVLRAPRQPLR